MQCRDFRTLSANLFPVPLNNIEPLSRYIEDIRWLRRDISILCSSGARTSVILERLRYPGSCLRVRVSSFCLTIFADVSNFTRIFYPFPRGKPWSTRKRQTTGTGVFCLLFLGRLNSTNFQHITQINNAFSTIYGELQQRKLPFSGRFSHAGVSWFS